MFMLIELRLMSKLVRIDDFMMPFLREWHTQLTDSIRILLIDDSDARHVCLFTFFL